MIFYRHECWTLTKEQAGKMTTGETHFPIAVEEHKTIDHKRNEDIREELGVTEVNIIIKTVKINDQKDLRFSQQWLRKALSSGI
jgi:hypothetical protein